MIQPPSGSIVVAFAGMHTVVSPPVVLSRTVKFAMPSLTFLIPRTFPFRSTVRGRGLVSDEGVIDDSRLSWCSGWFLRMAMWAPMWMFSSSIRWWKIQEREPELAPVFQSRDSLPTKRMWCVVLGYWGIWRRLTSVCLVRRVGNICGRVLSECLVLWV